MKKKEFYLQASVCDYLNRMYPKVIYRSDLAGIKMTIGQATQIKMIQKYRGWPDIIIYENAIFRTNKEEYFKTFCGLAIEIKCEKKDIFKKNGEPRNKHIIEQWKIIEELKRRGFMALFGIGFDHIREKIDEYLFHCLSS